MNSSNGSVPRLSNLSTEGETDGRAVHVVDGDEAAEEGVAEDEERALRRGDVEGHERRRAAVLGAVDVVGRTEVEHLRRL